MPPAREPQDLLRSALAALGDWAHRHHRALGAGTLALLAGFGVTAFGIAPLAPDAAELPRRLVVEAIEPQGLDAQLEALAGLKLQLRRSDVTRASDTVDGLLQRLGVADAAAATWIRQDPLARRLLEGVRLFALAESLGGVESLIEHRKPVEGPDSPTPDNLLRVSVGLEHVDDLRRDLDQALG